MTYTGSSSLFDERDDVIVVVCSRCRYRERYNAARVRAAYGNVPMPHLLTIIARTECTGRDSWGGCGLVYERPLVRPLIVTS